MSFEELLCRMALYVSVPCLLLVQLTHVKAIRAALRERPVTGRELMPLLAPGLAAGVLAVLSFIPGQPVFRLLLVMMIFRAGLSSFDPSRRLRQGEVPGE